MMTSIQPQAGSSPGLLSLTAAVSCTLRPRAAPGTGLGCLVVTAWNSRTRLPGEIRGWISLREDCPKGQKGSGMQTGRCWHSKDIPLVRKQEQGLGDLWEG